MPPNNQPSVNPIPAPIASGPAPIGSASPAPDASKQAPKNPNSTQSTLLLSEVRDNIVIMADGTFREVIACKSINFDLMSAREREGVEFSYQNFLNSLNFKLFNADSLIFYYNRIIIIIYINDLLIISTSKLDIN